MNLNTCKVAVAQDKRNFLHADHFPDWHLDPGVLRQQDEASENTTTVGRTADSLGLQLAPEQAPKIGAGHRAKANRHVFRDLHAVSSHRAFARMMT
jgi:hypothetical protein